MSWSELSRVVDAATGGSIRQPGRPVDCELLIDMRECFSDRVL
jgi:hypothetical protein